MTLSANYSLASAKNETQHFVAVDAAMLLPPDIVGNIEMCQFNTSMYRKLCNMEAGGIKIDVITRTLEEARLVGGGLSYMGKKSGHMLESVNIMTLDQVDDGYYSALITDRPNVFYKRLNYHAVVRETDPYMNRRFGI